MFNARALVCVALSLLIMTSRGIAQCNVPNINDPRTTAWSGKLLDALAQEGSCSSANTDDSFVSNTACNIFVGRVLKTVYGVDDFTVQSPGPNQVYYSANEIATLLQTGVWNGWTKIGAANSQDNLNAAAAQADLGNLVIAVWSNPGGDGHVALIGPGPMTTSTLWGLKTPPAASFTLNKRAKDFLGLPLACAFSKDKRDTTYIWAKTAG